MIAVLGEGEVRDRPSHEPRLKPTVTRDDERSLALRRHKAEAATSPQCITATATVQRICVQICKRRGPARTVATRASASASRATGTLGLCPCPFAALVSGALRYERCGSHCSAPSAACCCCFCSSLIAHRASCPVDCPLLLLPGASGSASPPRPRLYTTVLRPSKASSATRISDGRCGGEGEGRG